MMEQEVLHASASGKSCCKVIRAITKDDLAVVGEEGIQTSLPERAQDGVEILVLCPVALSERNHRRVSLRALPMTYTTPRKRGRRIANGGWTMRTQCF